MRGGEIFNAKPFAVTDSVPFRFSGLDSLHVRAPDGASAIVTQHGAQVVSWIPAHDEERLYLSPKSVFDDRAPIRGGVPLVFPQFADYGPLTKHGFIRTARWRVTAVDVDERNARATLRVHDSEDTRSVWPHPFVCEFTVIVGGNRLEMELRVENSGAAAFDFSAALHTYIRVKDVGAAAVVGLYGVKYRDRTRGDRELLEDGEVLTIDREIDRIYAASPGKLLVRDGRRTMSVQAQGFPDVVVWNPWQDKCASLADMPSDGYREMLCVEAAAIATRPTLSPGGSWRGGQILTASP